jgi:hypothetical protein
MIPILYHKEKIPSKMLGKALDGLGKAHGLELYPTHKASEKNSSVFGGHITK